MATVHSIWGFALYLYMKSTDKEWFKSRSYLHFDAQVSRRSAYRFVTNVNKVAQHSFYPLLRYELHSKKIYKDQNGRIKDILKSRPIAYASHLDSHIYSYYGKMLAQAYEQVLVEKGLSDCVLAFRSLGKSNIDFANEAFQEIESRSDCRVLALDISGFFDTLDHEYLKNSWAKILDETKLPIDHYAIYKSLTKYAYCNKEEVYKEFGISFNKPWRGRNRICTPQEFRSRVRGKGLIKTNQESRGIPQGTAISALLSNIYMLDFDCKMHALMRKYNGSYRRYCDDMLFVYSPKEGIDLKGEIDSQISACRLMVNESKTEVRQFKNGFSKKSLQYLGFTYDGEKILLRSAALARYSARVNKTLRLLRNTLDSERKKRGEPIALRRKKVYENYSHFGKRNFISYGLRAAEIMDSSAINKQLGPLWGRLNSKLDEIERDNQCKNKRLINKVECNEYE